MEPSLGKEDKVELRSAQERQFLPLCPSLNYSFLFSEEAISNNMISEGQKEHCIKRNGRRAGQRGQSGAPPASFSVAEAPFAGGCLPYLCSWGLHGSLAVTMDSLQCSLVCLYAVMTVTFVYLWQSNGQSGYVELRTVS